MKENLEIMAEFYSTILYHIVQMYDFSSRWPVTRKASRLFGPEGKFYGQNQLNSSQFLAHKPVSFASLTNGFI